MKIYSVTPHIIQNVKKNEQNEGQETYRSTAKSAALITASLLSLAAMAKSDIDYDGIYKNKIEQTSYQIANNKPIANKKHSQNEFDRRLSDEEKIHRFAIIFVLLGFFAPMIAGIFCGDTKEHQIDEKYIN